MIVRLSLCIVLAACHHAASPTPAISNSPGPAISNSGDKAAAPAEEVEHLDIVAKLPDGGVLQLRGDRSRAMADANQFMAAHCGADSYTITQEGEEAAIPGDPIHTEWRVHYQCNRPGP